MKILQKPFDDLASTEPNWVEAENVQLNDERIAEMGIAQSNQGWHH